MLDLSSPFKIEHVVLNDFNATVDKELFSIMFCVKTFLYLWLYKLWSITDNRLRHKEKKEHNSSIISASIS